MEKILCKVRQFFKYQCSIAVLDEAKGRWFVNPKSKNIPYLKAENAHGRHILVKPAPHVEPYYLLVDDLNIALLIHHHQLASRIFKPGRMVVETSPGNYQVWIHSDRQLSLAEKRYWLKKMYSDPGAGPKNRWGRCPGFRNRKQIHRTSSGKYPLAKLIWVDWKYKAKIPKIILSRCKKNNFPHQPRGGVCHKDSLTRSYYDKGDESATDFAYALALYRRGFTQNEIANQIIEQRQDWKNHSSSGKREIYLNRTLIKAQKIIC